MARKKRRRSKSSKAANLARRIIMIANGLDQAKPSSPRFILSNGKLTLSPEEYAEQDKTYEIDWSRY